MLCFSRGDLLGPYCYLCAAFAAALSNVATLEEGKQFQNEPHLRHLVGVAGTVGTYCLFLSYPPVENSWLASLLSGKCSGSEIAFIEKRTLFATRNVV